jgi:segregation and condensation protein B
LLGRDRTRVYALVRSGDLVAVPGTEADDQDLLRIDRSSVERWAVAGGQHGSPLTPRNAWAIIGLASGDASLADRCVGLLERREELSRIRGRLARDGLLGLAPRLRRRAALNVVHVPPAFFVELERDASLVRTGASAALPYGWTEFSHTHTQTQADPESQTQAATAWALDAYVPQAALDVLLEQVPAAGGHDTQAVLLRSIDGLWPFPAHCQLTPQPLAALDLLDYPDGFSQRRGRELLRALAEVQPTTVARRTARARTLHGPLVGKTLGSAARRVPRPVVEGDPRTETRAAAANIIGVLWATARQGATVKELRGATGMTRERLETAYEYLLENPPLGLAVQRQGDELFLVTAPEVGAAVERHLDHPRPVALSRPALEVLAIVAYKQPIARAGIEFIRGSNSDSALETLVMRGLVAVDEARLFSTTRAFLDFAGLRDLADLPPLEDSDSEDGGPAWATTALP